MSQLTAALIYEEGDWQSELIDALVANPQVTDILMLKGRDQDYSTAKLKTRRLPVDSLISGAGINQVFEETRSDYLLLILPGQAVRLGFRTIERFLQSAEDTRAGLIYADFR